MALFGTIPSTANVVASAITGTISSFRLPAGSIIQQILNTNTATPVGLGSGSWIDTGLSLTITPSSTSSKILIIANVSGLQTYNNSTGVGFQIARNGTGIADFGTYYGYPVSMYIPGGQVTHLDSPSSTSALTYKIQHQRQLGSGTGVVNGDASRSFLTVMEIAG